LSWVNLAAHTSLSHVAGWEEKQAKSKTSGNERQFNKRKEILTTTTITIINKNMQNKLHTTRFSSHHLMTSCIACPQRAIVEPASFLKLANFVDFTKLTNFA